MGQDRIEGYLLLATSFDGSMATQASFTTVRVVCQNTLSMADREGGRPKVRVPHRRAFDPYRVKQELGIVSTHAWGEFQELASTLATRKVSPKESAEWLLAMVGDAELPPEQQSDAALKRMSTLLRCVTSSPGSNLRSAESTAWGLLNGVTFYLDHEKKYRTTSNRLSANWFGDGAAMQQKAVNSLLQLVA
jgi:phage/plasmid-like protein (TIGR03299 family)